MNKRMLYCKNLETSDEPIGPLDICYLVRESQSKNFLGIKSKKVSKSGAYHYVSGLDTSNVAYISAYISKYIQKIPSQTNIKVTQSIFCAFDYFLEKDLRILIKFPGGIRKIFYIDDTQAIEANSEDLRTVFLSSILRSWNYKQYPIPTNCLFLEEINNIEAFDYLFESIKFILAEKKEIAKYPNLNNKIEALLTAFLAYLMKTRRFNFSIMNFSKLSNYDFSLAKYAIKPLKYLNLYEEALSFLANMLTNSTNPVLLSLEIDLLTYLKKYEDSLEVAKFVTSVTPENPDSWLSLAELYLELKKYDSCLRALNNVYFLKEFSGIEMNKFKSSEGIVINEIPIQKIKGQNSIGLKMNDILLKPKTAIDIYYGSSQFYLCENSDFLQDTTTKILTCPYYLFDRVEKKMYNMLLALIKEINFDSFIDLKRKIFCESTFKQTEDDKISYSHSEAIQLTNELKISINPYLEMIINNLIGDLKIFSIVVSEDDAYFNSLKQKDDLAISEVKFCIGFAILSERLKYRNTAMIFYTKALQFCFSKYAFIRKITLCSIEKDYKTAINLLGALLCTLSPDQFKQVNKTPIWIDKIILRALYEYQANEIVQYVADKGKNVIEYIKKVINKYKYWIEVGHEIHLIK